MSSISPAALERMKREGYQIEFQEFGAAGIGKSMRAAHAVDALRRDNKTVRMEDEIADPAGVDGVTGIRVWAK